MRAWAIIGWCFACACAHADALRLDDLGLRFAGAKVEITWNVATNRVPKTMNLYRVVPAKFSVGIISNLVVLGEFKDSERVRNALVPAIKGKESLFEEEPAHKAINLSPSRGLAVLFNTHAIPLPGEIENGAPSEEQALKLALQIAERLGVNRAELATKPSTQELFISRDARERGGLLNGKYTKRIIARGVTLRRAIEGVTVNGHGFSGGLYVNFGNNARVGNLDFSWRNLEFAKTSTTAEKSEIIRRIKQGEAVILVDEFDPAKIRKLTVTDVIPLYRGYTSSEVQQWVYPFVEIVATAEIEGGKIPVTLLCPILH